MANLNISGTNTGGSIYRLQNPDLEQVRKAIAKDGRDQVVFKAGDDIYVAEGDSLNLNGLNRGSAGKPAELTFSNKGKVEKATLIQFDDEVNSGWDGTKKAAHGVSFAYAGLIVAEIVAKVAGNKVLLPVNQRNSAMLLGGVAIALTAGAIYGATREPQGASKVPALGVKIN